MYLEPTKKMLEKLPSFDDIKDILPGETKIYFHFFTITGCDWYVASVDKNGDDYIFFGFACLNGWTDLAEWGSFGLNEMKEIKILNNTHQIEKDKLFKPKKAKKIELIVRCKGV